MYVLLHRYGWDVTEEEMIGQIVPEIRRRLNVREDTELDTEALGAVSGGRDRPAFPVRHFTALFPAAI